MLIPTYLLLVNMAQHKLILLSHSKKGDERESPFTFPYMGTPHRYIDRVSYFLSIPKTMFKTLPCKIISFFFALVGKKLDTVIVYSLSFNLADSNWPEEQFTSIRYLWYSLDYELCLKPWRLLFHSLI